MNLRHRFSLILIVGLVLCLALLGREFFRPEVAEQTPARVEKIATVADTSVPVAQPTTTAQLDTAAVETPAPNVSSGGAVFRGRVIDAATRQPVREFELEFHAAHQPQPGDVDPGARTIRAKDGRFELTGIPPRRWIVMASARGYQRFEIDGLQLSADAATETIIPLQRGYALRGRVFDETSGAGIASAAISFRESHVGRYDGNFRMRVSTTSRKDGSFVLGGVPAGSIILSVNAPKYIGREIDVSTSAQTSPLQVALSTGGALKGYLAASDGVTPVAGWVSVNNLGESYGNSMRTSDAGEFSFERLPPGRYRVGGRSGARSGAMEISLAKDERREGMVLALSDVGHGVRGVVSGLSPADLERTRIVLYQLDGHREVERAGVNAQGAYEIQAVKPGQIVLRASTTSGRQISKTVNMPTDADLVVNLEFQQGARLTGNVTRGGKPLVGAVLHPHSVQQKALWMDGVRTSERGEYVFEGMPNGQYYFSLDSYRSRNFEVNGDTVFDIDIPTGQFSGRAVEEGDKVPVVGADVFLWSAQPDVTPVYWRDRSDHFGEFTVNNLEPGDYWLSAYKPGYEMQRERVSYGVDSGVVTIRMRPGQGVEVRLREAGTGLPIRNAQVSERIDGRPGSGIRLRLDANGVGYLPRALTGSALTFLAGSYAPAVVPNWDGQALEVQFEKADAR
jgi:hypothetical protein